MRSPPSSAASPASAGFPIGYFEFVAMMAATMALQALAVDAMLPALGLIAEDLGVSDPNRRQLVVGVFLVAAGIGSLLPGPLSDRFGRRRVLLVCFGGYIAMALGCAAAPSFEMLIALRVAQALASAGLSVLPAAVIRDRHAGDAMARILSTVSMIFMIAPMVAPTLGQSVLLFAGWRAIFGLLALLGLIIGGWIALRLPETLDATHRQPIRPGVIARNMVAAATHRRSAGYVVGGSLTFAALLGYINTSEQLVAEHFGAGAMFPLLFGATALMMSSASFLNARIVERFGARRVSQSALLLYLVFSCVQYVQAQSPHETLWQFMPVIALNACMLGFIGANFSSIALQPFAGTAGAASSVQAFLRMVIAASLGIIIGQSYDNTARPLAIAFVACGVGALALVLFSEKGRLFTRREPAAPRGPRHGTAS
ncbi:Bcr/CflA subfamily drug resistance transporter [Novosphingobium nitrogenifigens DSM 19370]|uniref:Bcr/CflA family efflux transporter n=1 Tax=Novosphingobium nitrogenifigens DSM 19370 TaxID=983920 RepID=F1Z718_9SPHN|nr:multidrug effflux MFS transporter [Novosphingobium nitrogenifigens]EGD59622.1 Bcr/CflA subfamily drug resistance transporter [Novosphingobium nitrogenifigens DSM 19370]